MTGVTILNSYFFSSCYGLTRLVLLAICFLLAAFLVITRIDRLYYCRKYSITNLSLVNKQKRTSNCDPTSSLQGSASSGSPLSSGDYDLSFSRARFYPNLYCAVATQDFCGALPSPTGSGRRAELETRTASLALPRLLAQRPELLPGDAQHLERAIEQIVCLPLALEDQAHQSIALSSTHAFPPSNFQKCRSIQQL